MAAHLTATEARRLGITAPAGRPRTTRKTEPRGGAVTTCHRCGARFTTDAAEARHVVETHHARYQLELWADSTPTV